MLNIKLAIFNKKTIYATIVTFSLFWCFLFISVPFLSEGNSFFRTVSGIITLFFSQICHQIPERSFYVLGHPLAICARCSGIYLGFLMGVIVYPFLKKLNNKADPLVLIIATGMLTILTEVFISLFTSTRISLLFRSFTGLLLGSIGVLIIIPAIFEIVNLEYKT